MKSFPPERRTPSQRSYWAALVLTLPLAELRKPAPPLVTTATGGRAGGGASLTAEGEKALKAYEAMMTEDDFIEAMEHGMPPMAGNGLGIDRLVAFMTGAPSLREVVLFPAMRRVDDEA